LFERAARLYHALGDAQVGDKLTMSYAIRHLGFAHMAAGAGDAARQRLEESVRLRREIGFQPGVAAGLVALAHLAAGEGRRTRRWHWSRRRARSPRSAVLRAFSAGSSRPASSSSRSSGGVARHMHHPHRASIGRTEVVCLDRIGSGRGALAVLERDPAGNLALVG
jgi:hypothetical protein